jgi:CubicO group peptidase (beta-lactamase class C family)
MSMGGLSRTRLGRMHDVLAGYVERGELPGLVTLISRRGEVHVDAIGMKAAGGRDPMRRDTLFRIASMTKPITAAATMILVEECKLRLDEPVDRLLPELANRQVLKRLDGPLDETVPAKRPITLRDLLAFRMGFGQMIASPDAYPILKAAGELQIGMGPPDPSATPAPDEWMRRLGTLPLMHQPGEAWMYNTGSDVLGVLIARAAGQPLETFLRERIFEPLGMRDTGFHTADVDRLATAYQQTAEGLVVWDPPNGQWSRPATFPDGAAGLVSTADDLLAFARMLLRGGDPVLTADQVREMSHDQLSAEQREFGAAFLGGRGWGLGTSVVLDGPWAGAIGWDGGLGTSFLVHPARDLAVIVLTQRLFETAQAPAVHTDLQAAALAAAE